MGRQPAGQCRKKANLQEIARHWLSGGRNRLADDAAAHGIELPAELLADQDCWVWPENWPALLMFLRMETQWRIGLNGRDGLDYRVLEWLFSLYPVDDPRQLLEDLKVVEIAILEADRNG